MPILEFPPRSVSRNRAFGAIFAALTFSITTLPALSQGVPHLSVSQRAYHTLVAPGTVATADMCEAADSFCLANAVGNPLFTGNDVYASDAAGNIYVLNQILMKISPTGQIQIIGGEYGVVSSTPPDFPAPATTVPLPASASMAIDRAGNIYVGGFYSGMTGGQSVRAGLVLKIDTLGVIHRITALKSDATPAPVEGALSTTQYVSPNSIAIDSAGDVYLTDGGTATIRMISAKTEDMNTVVGCLASGCNQVGPPVSGEKASQHRVAGSVAVGVDGTLYLTDDGSYPLASLYSVTSDGIIHVLAENPVNPNYSSLGGFANPGPAATGQGSIGYPYGPISVDAAGDVYFASSGLNYDNFYENEVTNLVEVTKGTTTSPAQVIVLSSGPGANQGIGNQYGDLIPTLNPEGMPSTLTLDLPGSFTIDPSGRIVMPTQNANTANPGNNYQIGPFVVGVGYFDRNGSAVFNSDYLGTPGTDPTNPLVLTVTNSGTAPLETVNVGNSGYSYYLLPSPMEIEAEGGSGANPFTLDFKNGTCLTLYAPTKMVTLQPGESCTLVFHYTPNPTIPQAGLVTMYTNDPLGPLTINLSATPITETFGADEFSELFGNYNDLSISSTILSPASSVSTNGTFTINAAVASSVYDPSNPLAYTFGLSDYPAGPTGRIYAAVANDKTGASVTSPVQTLDADGKTTFTFTGLAPGSYSLGAEYLGDGTSKASFSVIQTLTVLPK